MYKPDSLREHITAANPDLRNDPDKLLVFADEGSIQASGTQSRSFEYAYKLNVIIIDFGGDEDAIFIPLLDWVATHQPDLLNNPDKQARGIRFQVDFNNHNSVDISIDIELTERVIVKQEGSKLVAKHVGEPTLAPPYTDQRWKLYKNDQLLAEWMISDTGQGHDT